MTLLEIPTFNRAPAYAGSEEIQGNIAPPSYPAVPTCGYGQRIHEFSEHTGMMNMKTDLQLQQDVLAELKWEPAVNAAGPAYRPPT